MKSRCLIVLGMFAALAATSLYADDPSVPESEQGALQITPVSALDAALADTSTVSFYGAVVRNIYVNQPAVTIIESAAAQQQFGAGSGIVAVIDTGIDPQHPAFAGVLVPGYDFIRNKPGIPNEWLDLNPTQSAALANSASLPPSQKIVAATLGPGAVPILDQSTVVILDGGGGSNMPSEFGHGTMVAGLIHLVAPTALIMPLKAFNSDGTASVQNVSKAIRYAADHGANVVNMSFSVNSNDSTLQSAISYASSKGVILVASSGNLGSQLPAYPAAYRNVIGVGSVNDSDLRSVFSNYDSSAARTSAPGEALITTYPGNNYAGVWGTSFSTALVSGGASLAYQISPTRAKSAIYAGVPINQDMGDTRLQLVDALTDLTHPSH